MTEPGSLNLDKTSPRARKWYWLIIRFSLVRLVLALALVVFLGLLPFYLIVNVFGQMRSIVTPGVMWLAVTVAVTSGVLVYWLYVRFIEWRPLDELSLKGAADFPLNGLIAGATKA